MSKTEAEDAEFQKLVEHHKADIQASNMTRDELIDLLARNLASYNFLCRSYEANCRQLEGAIKMRAQICDLLEERNSKTEGKFFAAVNAIPKAIQAGMEAGVDVGKKILASSAGKKGGVKKMRLPVS